MKSDGKEQEILSGYSSSSNYGIDDESVFRALYLRYSMIDSLTTEEFENMSNEEFQKSTRFSNLLLSGIGLTCLASKTF